VAYDSFSWMDGWMDGWMDKKNNCIVSRFSFSYILTPNIFLLFFSVAFPIAFFFSFFSHSLSLSLNLDDDDDNAFMFSNVSCFSYTP